MFIEKCFPSHKEFSQCPGKKTVYRSFRVYAMLRANFALGDGFVKTKPLAQLGREKSHAVPPRFISRTRRSWIYLFRPVTGSSVHPTKHQLLGITLTGGFHCTLPKETFSRCSPISSGHLPVTRPGQRGILIAELYYAFSEFQEMRRLASF